MTELKQQFENANETESLDRALALLKIAKEQQKVIYQHINVGDRNTKWSRWYSSEIRKSNNGFPTFKMLDVTHIICN